MNFEIHIQYVYGINELYKNARYRVDNGWEGFKTTVKNLPKLERNDCEIPSVLSLTRSVKVNYAYDYTTGKKIEADGSIMGVPLKEWVKLAGFKDRDEYFKHQIVVASGNTIPTIGSLRGKVCPWTCNGCHHQDCKNGDENIPALYSSYVRVGIEPLDPKHHICISRDNYELLWPETHPVNPAKESQVLRDFFNQPGAIQVYTDKQDGLLKIFIRSCALYEK